MDKDINFRSLGSGTAVLISLAGLVVLLTPVIYLQRKLPLVTAKSLVDSARNLSTEKSMYCYMAAFFIGTFLTGIAFLF